MSVGFIMLVHESLDRAAEVARHYAKYQCPVVIHVDERVSNQDYRLLEDKLVDLKNIEFSQRYRCEWGGWSLVEATQDAADQILSRFPNVQHVFLCSGSCLPLRRVPDLENYLSHRPDVNFIESVTTHDAPWTIGGLDTERFTLRFPFSWKTQRKLFDKYVKLQRKLGVKRRIPEGLVPHMGSQWWCLTRETLLSILNDPQRDVYDKYFKRVWIPDESYFQTLVRKHSKKVESRSLTLSKFDFQGKPHIFYDDHIRLLRRSDCFVARKIWKGASKVYEHFLGEDQEGLTDAEPKPEKIDRVFSKVAERRTIGRAGLRMQSRYLDAGGVEAYEPYSVFSGFDALYTGFDVWLARATSMQVHGHLFKPEGVEFIGGQQQFSGMLCQSTKLRDYNSEAFLVNLLWNTQGKRQCFMHGPEDVQDVNKLIVEHPSLDISVISGAWAIPLFMEKRDFNAVRREAARLQKIEIEMLQLLQGAQVRARVRIWSLADFIANPNEHMRSILDEVFPTSAGRVTEFPVMRDLSGFGAFLQILKNQGMHAHVVGDFPVDLGAATPAFEQKKTYEVR